MKPLGALEPTLVFVEIRSASFHAHTGLTGVDLPIERGPDGHLTPASAAAATAALQGLLGTKTWLSRIRVCCAIGSRGVLLRPVSLPVTAPAELSRLLQLKIESELPLPPEALAWGWLTLPNAGPTDAATPRQEVLVAAVKKEVIEEYAAILGPVDPDPMFTVAALARMALVPIDQRAFAVLDIGPTQSELTLMEAGVPPSVQLLPWGENRWLDSLSSRLGQTRDEAVATLASLPNRDGTDRNDAMDAALEEAVSALAEILPKTARDRPLWISGPPVLAQLLAGRLGGTHPVGVLPVPIHPGQTAATLGSELSLVSRPGRKPLSLLLLQIKHTDSPDRAVRAFPRRQVAIAAALLVGVLAFPYIEALLFQPRLARRLAGLKGNDTQFATIDRELSFLRYLELNQSPHLDAAFVIAQAAPQGVRLNSLSMNRHGEISLSGFLQNLAQVGDFRLKLINSGFFSTIVVEDQSPTPDRQRINFRITGRWKSAAEREALALGPVLPEPASGKGSVSNSATSPKTPTGTNSATVTTNPVPTHGSAPTNSASVTNTASKPLPSDH